MDEDGVTWGEMEVEFLTTLTLVEEVEGFYFLVGRIGSTKPLLLVLTGNASYSFSLSEIRRINPTFHLTRLFVYLGIHQQKMLFEI